MNIQCPVCDQISEIDCEIAEGQSLLCPYCNRKFTYRHSDSTIVLPPTSRKLVEQEEGRNSTPNKKKLWSITRGMMAASVVVTLCSLGLFFTVGWYSDETPSQRVKREFKEVEERLKHYRDNESIRLDLRGRIDKREVFGLRWNEMPRRKEYKLPCEVVYDVDDDLFSEVSLLYSDGKEDAKGLCMVSLKKKGCEESREASLRIFERMSAIAENATGGRFTKLTGGTKLTGLPRGDSLVSVIFTESTLADNNPNRIFMAMRPNEKEMAKQKAALNAEVEIKRRWYNQQLGRHNLNEHSFQVRDSRDGDDIVYCLCLFKLSGLTITITEAQGMLICDGPIDRGYAAELLAARKEMYRVDGK